MDTPKLVLEARPSFIQQQGQEPTNPLPVQPGPLLILMLVLWQEAPGVLEIRPHLTQTHQGRMWPTSDMNTASGNDVTFLDVDEVTIQTVQKKYQKRVWASHRLSKGSLWSEAQLKRIANSHQAVWGHDHKSIRTEWVHALVEDCSSFEMCKMMVRTDQLLHIAAATDSHIYTRDSEAETHGQAKTLVLSLKQYHTHYYYFYKKVMTRSMVDLQGLHLNDAFSCSNVSSSLGLKSFCPWCFKLGATLRQ